MLIGVFYIRLLSSKPDPPSTVSTPGLSSAYCTRLDDVCFLLCADDGRTHANDADGLAPVRQPAVFHAIHSLISCILKGYQQYTT